MLDWVSIHDPAVRAAAKAAYCEKHPLPEPTTNGKAGYVSSPSGHHHYYGGYAGQRVAEMAAHADCEPIPETLVPFERDDQLVWIGQHGVYPIDTTPDLFKAAARCSGPLSTPTTSVARRVASIRPSMPLSCGSVPGTAGTVPGAPFSTSGRPSFSRSMAASA